MKKGARLLIATAEKISAKTLGILLGLCVGASASGLLFLSPKLPPPDVTSQEWEAAEATNSQRQPSSAGIPRYGSASRIVAPYHTSAPYQGYASAGYSSSAHSTDALPDAIDSSAPGFIVGGLGAQNDLTNFAEPTHPYYTPTPSENLGAGSSEASAASSGGFVGGTGGATSTETETETSTSSYTKYLSLDTPSPSVYSGETLSASFGVEMRRSDTYSREPTWADQLTVAAYTNSGCTAAASGTLSVTASSLAMSLGSATVTNIIYTTASAQTEETIYLKFTAASASVSRCSSAVYVKQKFNAGAGSVLFQHGGNGASGLVAASKSDIPVDSAIDSQNRIVVAGVSLNAAGRHELAVWRYLPNGSLDTSFAGGNGYLTFQPGGNGAAGATNANKFDFPGGGSSLVIDSQNRILIAGASRNAAGKYEITLWRFEEDGDLDTTFGGTGYVMFQPGGNGAAGAAAGAKYDEGGGVVIDSAGRYMVVGNSQNSFGALTPVLVRFLSDGAVDTSFGTAGVVALGDGTGGFGGQTNATKEDWATLAVATSDGGYVLGGGSNTSAGSYVSIVWKVTSTGSLDTSFGGGDGWMQMNEGAANALGAAFADRDDGVSDLNVSSAGKITVMMYANTPSNKFEVTLTRLEADGSVDTSFGTAGSTSVLAGGISLAGTDPAKKYDVPSRLLTDSTGRLIITANAWNDSWGAEPVMIRLDANGDLDTTFSSDGIYTYAQNNAAGPGGATANGKKDGKIQPTIDGTTWKFLSQMPLLIDGGGRYVMPFAASVAAHPAAELGIIRVNTDGTIDD
jgi:uncharacterized delta-60 repeat protein